MKKHVKIISVLLALVMLVAVVSVTGFAKNSFSDEIQQVSDLANTKERRIVVIIEDDCNPSPCTGTETDYTGTATDYCPLKQITTKTDFSLCGFFGNMFEKICDFFRGIFSFFGLS